MTSLIPKYITFDLDGTLVDSGPTVLKIINCLRGQLFKNPLELVNLFPVLSMGGEDMIRLAIGLTDPQDISKYLKLFRSEYGQDTLKDEYLYEWVPPVLNWLKEIGVPMAICTNKPKILAQKTLKRHLIDHFFDIVIDGDDVESKKPDPEGIHKIMKAASVLKSQMIYVGDSRVDQVACENAGVRFIWHDSGSDDGINKENMYNKFSNYEQFKLIFLE